MKSFDCTFRKLPLIAATGLLLGGTAAASGVELFATNNLPQAGDSDELISFDSANPVAVTTIGNTGVTGAGFGGLDYDAAGNLYGYVSFGGTSGLYSVDPGTGVATVVGSLSGVALNDISFNPSDGLMYGSGADTLYTIDTNTGATNAVGNFTGSDGFQVGMGHDAFGTIYIIDIVSDQMTSGGLAQAPLIAMPVDCNFSQGLFTNWSASGVAQSSYHGAIGNNPAFFSHLYEVPTDGSAYNFLGAFSPDGDFPTVETGDLTAAPSGACPPSNCPADIAPVFGTVDVNDLLLLLANWGTDGPGACIFQDNGEEQTVDVNDLLALLAAWGDCPEPPDPGNDFCSEADDLGPITTTTVIEDSLVDATPDGVGDCQGVANDGAGRWYKILGTGSTMTASLCSDANAGITFDGRIHVFCGLSCTSLNCIAANDDAGCNVDASLPEVQFCTAEGEDYYVLVHMAQGGTAGDYTLTLDTFGDQCQPDAECIPLAGDNCDDALPLDGNGDYAYDTTGYNTDGNPHATCEFDGQTYSDKWYTYTADFTGILTITTCSQAAYDTDLVVYDNSGPAPCPPTDTELLACNDDTAGCDGFTSQIDLPVAAGDQLLIRVGGWNDGDQGPGTLSLIKGDIFEFVCPDGASQENEACLGNGTCDTPSEDVTNGGCNNCTPVYSSISCGESVCGTGFTYSSPADLDCDGELDDVDGDGGPCDDVNDAYSLRDTDWYLFTLDAASDVVLTCSADGEALFGIVDISDCGSAAFVTSGTTGGAGGEIVLNASLAAGNWVAFASPNVFTGLECGNELNYAMTLACGTQATGACCTNGGADCADGVAEADCASQGGEFFADQLCADIACTEQAAYQYDDGVSENALGLTAGGGQLWLTRYDANSGADTIVDIAASFGDAVNMGSCLVGGENGVWAIYQGDGSNDPTNATLLASGNFAVAASAVNSDVLQVIDVTDTAVTGSFYIAVGVSNPAGCFESPLDQTSGGADNDCWIVGNTASLDINDVDLTTLGNNDVPPTDVFDIGFGGFWMLRGNN